MKIIIIGGVAGGMSAATRLRRLDESAEIIVFEKGPYVSFANCGLPYYVSGEINQREKLLVQTPQALKARFNIEVRPFHEVIAIDPNNREVTVQNQDHTFTESYDKLILSPGAKPIWPNIPGLEQADNTFSLRNLPDLDAIMAKLETPVKETVVIGAGFIGIEMAENLAKRGLKVTIIEKAPQILPPLDEEMAKFVENEITANQVQVITGQSAAAFEDQGKTIILDNGNKITSDLTILAIGVAPDSHLASQAGIKTGVKGGILVDQNYQTNLPDIYAVGDAIVVNQQITNQETLISLASPANRQGRQVADVIMGKKGINRGSIGTAIVRAFKMTAASTGISERQAEQIGFNPSVVHITAMDHAGYYPGASPIYLKLVFNKETGQIYGAQAVGLKGIDKRIDILATAIKGKLTIFDLPELEFTYAPPFGAAKDPVNLIGYAAMNLAEGLSESVQWHQVQEEVAKGCVILDVRTDAEYAKGRIKNSINIPLHQLRNQLDQLNPNTSYIVSCGSGQRSYIAERILKQKGYKVRNLDGSFGYYSIIKSEDIIRD